MEYYFDLNRFDENGLRVLKANFISLHEKEEREPDSDNCNVENCGQVNEAKVIKWCNRKYGSKNELLDLSQAKNAENNSTLSGYFCE